MSKQKGTGRHRDSLGHAGLVILSPGLSFLGSNDPPCPALPVSQTQGGTGSDESMVFPSQSPPGLLSCLMPVT